MRRQNTKPAKPASLWLNGWSLPWVESTSHLGHTLNEYGTMDSDCKSKRAQFIQEANQINEQFSFASPIELLQAHKLYVCSFYGSNLWDLGGITVETVYSAWRRNVRICWKTPLWTPGFLVSNVLAPGITSVKTDIISRYVSFFQGLVQSPCIEVVFLAELVSLDQ